MWRPLLWIAPVGARSHWRTTTSLADWSDGEVDGTGDLVGAGTHQQAAGNAFVIRELRRSWSR